MDNAELAEWLVRLEKKVDDLVKLYNPIAPMLIKWVIFPLIVVVGGLIGLDLTGVT